MFYYNPNLGSSLSQCAAKRMKGETHFRVVPCTSCAEATSIAVHLQHQGQGLGLPCLDMEQVRAQSRSSVDWKSIVSKKDATIASLWKLFREL